ncbi:UDP-2,3-diacylglucosamine diphosphatase [Pasteurella testudinis]|uniref:UDP-2,3-diacylglucosamine diphosphatase n=1 Tax=Pasteurella testudinis TaxID=761 RepID=UPI004059A384
MTKTYFIADLHLSEQQPHLTALFSRFMQNEAVKGEALYILGDLFDFWIGDDENSALAQLVQTEIKRLTDKGIKVYFQHGNRDFLIGKRFTEKCGLMLLPEYQIVNLYGTPVLLCHGDTLCTDDINYQAYRKKVHSIWRQKVFLCLPLFIRLRIANKIRRKSQRQKSEKPVQIMDVNPDFVLNTMQRFAVETLIHGHTHRQAIHHSHAQNRTFTRIVLGDWRKSAPYLVYDKNGYEFAEIK